MSELDYTILTAPGIGTLAEKTVLAIAFVMIVLGGVLACMPVA